MREKAFCEKAQKVRIYLKIPIFLHAQMKKRISEEGLACLFLDVMQLQDRVKHLVYEKYP